MKLRITEIVEQKRATGASPSSKAVQGQVTKSCKVTEICTTKKSMLKLQEIAGNCISDVLVF